MSVVEIPCEKEGVLALLPHREPFVWVSRIVACEAGVSLVAELDIDPELPLFKGHFPTKPVLPGVIIMEALAQASCCCLMMEPARAGHLGYLVGIDNAKFREQVFPGDTVRLEVHITKKTSRMCVAEVRAFKHDILCASAVQKYVMGPSVQS